MNNHVLLGIIPSKNETEITRQVYGTIYIIHLLRSIYITWLALIKGEGDTGKYMLIQFAEGLIVIVQQCYTPR